MERISSYYYYESRTQGKQSALIGQIIQRKYTLNSIKL